MTKIGGRNDNINSIGAGISGDTVVITDQQICIAKYFNAYKHHPYTYIYHLNKNNYGSMLFLSFPK